MILIHISFYLETLAAVETDDESWSMDTFLSEKEILRRR